MSRDLTGQSIQDTFEFLLTIDPESSGISGTLRQVYDGNGTAAALWVSEDAIKVGSVKIEGRVVQLYDSDESNWVKIQANGTTTSNYTITLPAALPASSKFFQIDNTGAVSWEDAGASSVALDDITDVTITSLADGEVLVSSSGTFINRTLSEASIAAASHTHTLSDITDAGTIASQDSDSVSITGGSISGITDLAVADGGTGASTAADARTNLGVAIGSDVQAYDAELAAIAALATTDGNIIVGNGSTWVAESGSTARASLGAAAASHSHTLSDITDSGTAAALNSVDEDTMSSDSDTLLPTQQSVKAYVDNGLSGKAASSHTHAASDITSGTLAHEQGGLEADVSAYDGLIRISGGSTTNIKCNYSATTAPATTDDSPDGGYSVGSFWLDTTNDKAYVCLDASDDAAVWTEITGGGGLTEWTAADSSGPSSLKFYEDTDFGSNYIEIRGGAPTSDRFHMLNATAAQGSVFMMAATGSIDSMHPAYRIPVRASTSSGINAGEMASVRVGELTHPFGASAAGHYYSPIGCEGIDISTEGLTLANDTIYLVPFWLPSSLNDLVIGVHTADASGTADLELQLFAPVDTDSVGQPIAGSVATTQTISNISTSGVKTSAGLFQTASAYYGGHVWLAIRADNIGTSLKLANVVSINDSEARSHFGIGTDYTAPSTSFFGYYISSRTSMPSSLANVTVTGILTTPIGVCAVAT